MESRKKHIRKKAVSKQSEHPPWTARHFKIIFYAIVFSAGALYLSLDPQYKTGIYNDDALYVITAHDFWNTPAAHPLLEIKPDFPLPGLPLLLAPVVGITKHLGRVSVTVSILSVLLLGLWLRRRLSPGQTLAVVALYAFHPLVGRFSGIVMPDPYYRLMAIAAFFLMDLLLENPTVPTALGLGFVLGWGSLIRPEGAVLLFSVAGVLCMTRRGRKLIPVMLIPLAGWLALIVMWFKSRQAGATEYGPDLSSLLLFWRHHVFEVFPFFFRWFGSFLNTSWSELLDIPPAVSIGVTVAAFGLFLAGWFIGFRRLWRKQVLTHPVQLSVAVFCVSFSLVHIFWHVADARYFITLLPFSLIFIVPSVKWNTPAKIGLLALLLLCANENVHAVYQSLWAPNPMNAPPRSNLKWLRENTRPTTKVISNIAPTIDLYTNRPTSPLFNATSVDLLQYLLASRNFEYIVLRAGSATDWGDTSAASVNIVWDRYRRWMRNYPAKFPCVYIDPQEASAIYHAVAEPQFVAAYEKFIAASHDGEAKLYQKSFVEVNEALSLDPDLGSATNLLGALYFMANDMESAEAQFLKTAALLPDSPNADVNLASLYNRQGKSALAAEYLEKGLSINALNGDAAEFKEKVEKLKVQWTRNDCELFIDFPHPSLYKSAFSSEK